MYCFRCSFLQTYALLVTFKGFPVFEIRKNLDLRKVLVTPKIFLKSRFHCTAIFSKHSRNIWLMHFWAKIFYYCNFYIMTKYRKNWSNEIFWPKKRISQIFGLCKIWLMWLFPRTKSCIRQGPSVLWKKMVKHLLRLQSQDQKFKIYLRKNDFFTSVALIRGRP